MNSDIYWIYIQTIIGYGSRKLPKLIEEFSTPKAFFESSFRDKKMSDIFSARELERIKNVNISAACDTVEKCEKRGYKIITPDSDLYPVRLMHIINPPAVLYADGEMPPLDDEVSLAIVGTRKATRDSREITFELSNRLAAAGAIIVSGGALGIDSSAHTGAIKAGKKTVAVLGCGLSYPYLSSNEELRCDIRNNGALISEFQPDRPVTRSAFPVRNRILSGLCLGTVVIEAPYHSGALITATHALEQGRDIFVVPGAITSDNFVGSNRLIRDGAKAVISPIDILEEYATLYPHRLDLTGCEEPLGKPSSSEIEDENRILEREESKIEQSSQSDKTFVLPKIPDGISDDAKLIFSSFTDYTATADDLILRSGVAADAALEVFTELEIMGLITALPGGRYQICM